MATLEDPGPTEARDSLKIADNPSLFDGQRLDQPTFHELYSRMPEDFRAELIDGVVFLMNLAVFEDHGRSDSSMAWFLYSYRMETPGTIVQGNTSTKIGPNSEVQPDCALRIDPDFGGRTSSSEGHNYTIEAPELVVEISSSTLRFDLTTKKRAYEEAGALEYLVVDVLNQKFHWFLLNEGRFEPLPRDPDGFFRSRIFPGLWLDPDAFLREDGRAMLATLRRGLESPEHGDFVERLRQNRAKRP